MPPAHTLDQLRSGALQGARRLTLRGGLRALPPEVFELADTLEVLDLSGNQLSALPEDLPRLHRLRVLFASDNPFEVLPPVLGDCPALEQVGFKACRLHTVPEAALPARLRWLTLTANRLTALPRSLGERPRLQKLLLAGNALSRLPDSLAEATHLELLRLSANALPRLPSWLARLPRLAWVALSGNPLGWTAEPGAALPEVRWNELVLAGVLGRGASGEVHALAGRDEVLKLFHAAMTSDGDPRHERLAGERCGAHPALCTPVARLVGHPEGRDGLLLPRLPADWTPLAAPPTLDGCTRDDWQYVAPLSPAAALMLARCASAALAHLHALNMLHGDLYAHNLLCAPDHRGARLTDLGAATVLPRDGSAAAWLQVELRSLGILLEELARQRGAPAGLGATDPLMALAAALQGPIDARPAAAEVLSALERLSR